MKEISVEEIIENKVLPFDVLNVEGERVLSAGEILTPGKALKLRDYEILFKHDVLGLEGSFAKKFKNGEVKNLEAELREAVKVKIEEGILLSDFIIKGSLEFNKAVFVQILNFIDINDEDFALFLAQKVVEFSCGRDFIRWLMKNVENPQYVYTLVNILKYNDVKEFES